MIQVKLVPNCNWLKESGHTQMEEAQVYDSQLQDIYENPRWYLDNLDSMTTYRVSWKDYRTKSATLPLKFVKSIEHL